METKSVKGSQTEKNLLKAFAGESQAKNRYTFFAKVARKEGYEKVAVYFEETARNEEEHAKIFFKFLEGGMVEITASYPAGVISGTVDNLSAAAAGEHEEWADLYPEFARVAEEEGFKKIATAFRLISAVEKAHEERYKALYENVKKGTIFKKAEKQVWRCRKCGFEYEGLNAPAKCPICDHPQAYFEIKDDRY